ncbi:MAG: type II secretion system F family protein [Armatimonadota bacterium]|nr:type II secretion system F family protein [Armatimonadota bacterium]
MPRFIYRAKDNAGNSVSGALEAESERAAAALIRQKGYWPIEIRVVSGQHSDAHGTRTPNRGLAYYLIEPIWTGVRLSDLAFFYRQLATLLASGMTLAEALSTISRRMRGRLGRIVREAAVHVQNGQPFSDTLARYPRVFSPLQLSLVRAGETSGVLDQMIGRIASCLEYELTIRRRIASATFYPKLLAICILVIPLVPKLVLQGSAAFLRAVWVQVGPLAVGLVLLVVFLKLVFQFEFVRLIWDCAKLQFPILGWTARKIAMSRFSRALAALYEAGVPIAESVAVAADACGNIYLARKLKGALAGLRSGATLTESLAGTQAVSSIVLDMLATGEKTGSTGSVLNKVADYMDEEADSTLQKVGPVLFVGAVLIAGVIVGFMVVNFYAGYFGQLLGGSGQ